MELVAGVPVFEERRLLVAAVGGRGVVELQLAFLFQKVPGRAQGRPLVRIDHDELEAL